MLRISAAMMCGVVVLGVAGTAQAQVKVIPGEKETVTATVEAVEQASRTVVIRTKAGELRSVELGPNSQIAQIKVGDVVNATYYENLIIRKKPAGEADVDTLEVAGHRGATKAGGTIGVQQAITATISAIDLKVPSIALTGPRGWAYSSKVQDKKALEQVKVGDKVDLTWTAAVLVSVTPAATSTK
jgi:hypothetical protein